MSESNEIHPLVMAEVQAKAANALAQYERARVAGIGHNQASMTAYRKSQKVTELGKIARSWAAVANTLGSTTEES